MRDITKVQCPKCKSERILEGSFHNRSLTRCLDCGTKWVETDKGAILSASELPSFDSVDEMLAFLDEQKGKNKKSARRSPSKKRSAKKVADPVDQGKQATGIENEMVHQSIHFYVRSNDTFQAIKRDAREEKKVKMPNVRIFVHDHLYGAECIKSCQEIE